MSEHRRAYLISPPARDLIFVLMLISVACFLAVSTRPTAAEPGGVFPTKAQLKMFALDQPLVFPILALICNTVFLLGMVLCVYFLLVMRKRNLAFGVPSPPLWNLWDVARAAVIFLYIGMVLSILNPLPVGRAVALTVYTVIAQGIAVLYLFCAGGGEVGETLVSIGLRARPFFRQAGVGLLAYIAFIPIFVALVLATTLLGRWGDIELEPQQHFSFFARPHSAWGYLSLAAFMGCIAPVFEEIFFRGFLYRAIKRRRGTFCAILSSSLLFSVLHFNIGTLLPIFGLGVLLAYICERTGSLIAPITIHILQNSIALSTVLVLLWIKQTY